MDKEERDKKNKREELIRYRQLIDYIRTTARISGREDAIEKYEKKIKALAKIHLKRSHKIATPWLINNECEKIKSYTQQILRCASDYIQYSKFNNNYTNNILLNKFNESCDELAEYMEIDITPESEDKINEEDFLVKINDPLTPEHLKKYVEIYYTGDKKHGFYGNLMRENSCGDKLNQDKYRAMREKVFISEVEQMLKMDEKKFKKRSNYFKKEYVINELLKPIYIITGNKGEYIKNRSYYSVAKKEVISDLKYFVDKHGVEYLVTKYNEIRAKIMEDEKNYKFSDEECKIYWLMDYIRVYSHNIPGILSFFIDRKMFDDKGKYRADGTVDIRYYINIGGEDIYQFTEEYIREAKLAGIPFHIKVVDAERGESDRTERLVIYSSFEAMQKNLEILNNIKKDNPKMKYQKPPITVATIDDWIGFGSEPKVQNSSYNLDRAKLIQKAIEEVFEKRTDNESGQKIIKQIEANPQLITRLRKKIEELSESFGVSKKHFFLDKEDEEYFEDRKSRYIFSCKCAQVNDYGSTSDLRSTSKEKVITNREEKSR